MFHSLHKGDERKPTEVTEEHSFSNSVIPSGTPHPPTPSPSPSTAVRNTSVVQGQGDPRHWRS